MILRERKSILIQRGARVRVRLLFATEITGLSNLTKSIDNGPGLLSSLSISHTIYGRDDGILYAVRAWLATMEYHAQTIHAMILGLWFFQKFTECCQ